MDEEKILIMKKDILNRTDIELLIDDFYKRVLEDELLGSIFTETVKINWETHLPLMCDFWENTLFFTGKYKGNPMNLHQHLNRVYPLDSVHFDRWVQLFTASVNQYFKGANARLAKKKAKSLAAIIETMVLKHKPGTLQR